MTRRISETNSTPSTDPTMISAVDFKYAGSFASAHMLAQNPSPLGIDGAPHTCAMKNAGKVNTAPAATDSPIDPAVRAMFSSRMVPLPNRSTAMPITAAGYVAAIVCPARSPRYAFAAPRTTVITSPSISARAVNSFILSDSGTNGRWRRSEPIGGVIVVWILLYHSALFRQRSFPPAWPARPSSRAPSV